MAFDESYSQYASVHFPLNVSNKVRVVANLNAFHRLFSVIGKYRKHFLKSTKLPDGQFAHYI